MSNHFVRKLIEVEIRLGFLSIPSHGIELMPDNNTKIQVKLDGQMKEVTYNSDHRRFFGLTAWFKQNKLKPGDEIIFSKEIDGYELKIMGIKEKTAEKKEAEEEESEQLTDISGLSAQAKGNIVEDRIKELVLLHGQGLLSVYKPVSDTEGIDLIIIKNGNFNPIFLQVKSRYVLNGKQLLIDIRSKTFNPNTRYYVVGAYFDPKTLEIFKNIIFIPSEDILKLGIKQKESYRVVTSLESGKENKWSSYVISKNDLATELLNKFAEMEKYIK